MRNGTVGDVDRARVWVERDRAATRRELAKTKHGKLHHLRGVSDRSGGGQTRTANVMPPWGSTGNVQREQQGGTNPGVSIYDDMIPGDDDTVRDQVDQGSKGEAAGVPDTIPDTPNSVCPEASASNHDRECVEVVNLSDRQLTESELSLLGKGLSFVPSKRQTLAQLIGELKEWERLMRLREFWDGIQKKPGSGEDYDDSRYKSSKWTPPKGRDPWLDLYIEEVSNSVVRGLRKKGRANLSKDEDEALISLMKDDSIIIRPADKGSSFVIMNKKDYISGLSDEVEKGECYDTTGGDITPSVLKKVDKLATRLEKNGYIGKHQRRYLIPPRPTPGKLQGNPKIHKKGAPMRAVVSGRGHATERMAELAERHLDEHVESTDSYIRDTSDFLNKLQGVSQPVLVKEGHKPLLFCMDVAKLYPSVPRNEGIAACREALEARSVVKISTKELLEVIELVLDNNNFQLGSDRHYVQTDGTAIGSRLGRNFACTYMGAWERELLSSTDVHPDRWYRFIDDIWGLWPHGEEALRTFHDLANRIHPNIKVDLRVSDNSIEFLDVEVLLSEAGYISTNLHTKPTDARAYLHYSSDHPPCVKTAIPKGLGMRLKRICSAQTDYQHHKEKLVSRLSERGYPRGEVANELRKVDRMRREALLVRRGEIRTSEESRVPMVVTFSSFLPDVTAIMRKNRHILQKSDRLKKIFRKDPMVAYKRGSNLKDLLVHRKTRKALGTRGRQDCGGGCVICKVFYEGDTVPGAERSLHYDRTIGCKTSNLVYGIWCAKCSKVVYVGQTGDTVYKRMQNHLSSIRCKREGRIPVNRHFTEGGHNEEDFRVIGLERTWGNSEDRRKFREMRWVGLLGTRKESDGENVRREG